MLLSSLAIILVGKEVRAVMAYMASLIWTARNRRLFQHKQSQPLDLLRRCICFYHDQFPAAYSTLSTLSTQFRYWSLPLLFPQPTVRPTFVSWKPPSHGVIVVNFDGHQATAGYIIRDHDGPLLVVGGKLLTSSSVLFAELNGAWLGLLHITTTSYPPSVWLQGASALLVSWLEVLSLDRFALSP